MVQRFHSLYPLEDVNRDDEIPSSAFGVRTMIFKGISSSDGQAYAIRRIDSRQVTLSPFGSCSARQTFRIYLFVVTCTLRVSTVTKWNKGLCSPFHILSLLMWDVLCPHFCSASLSNWWLQGLKENPWTGESTSLETTSDVSFLERIWSYSWTQWDFMLGVGSLWFSMGFLHKVSIISFLLWCMLGASI